jgi:hypothetical protein
MSSNSRLPVLALAACLLVAAGCGGSDDESSGASDWADSVCSATTTWTQSISSALGSLQDGNLSESSLESAVDDATEATRTFADELRDAGTPDTDDGQQAKNLIDQLGNDIEEGLQELEDDLDSASGGAGVLTAISQITATLATMSSQVAGVVEDLQQLDPAGELETAINDSDQCESLRSGG